MIRNHLKTLGAFFCSVLIVNIGFIAPVHALDYVASLEFDIQILENRSALVTQKISITNDSIDFLTSSFSVDFPFENVESIKVELDGNAIPANIENKRLWVEFNANAINTNEKKDFTLKYTLTNFVDVLGDVRTFTWPDFAIESEDASYPVRVSYPLNWEDVLYTSQGIDGNIAFESNRAVSFTNVNSKLLMFVGKNGLKQVSMNLNDKEIDFSGGDLIIPIRKGLFVSRAEEYVSISNDENGVTARVGLQNYPKNRNLQFYSKDITFLEDNLSLGRYFEGYQKVLDPDTNDPTGIYKRIIELFTPSLVIPEWERLSIDDIVTKNQHTDLDYANALVGAYRANGIPAHIVYGVARYPDDSYKWHSWVVYMKNANGEVADWDEADPFLADITGDNYLGVPPDRVIWGIIPSESDLRDISRDVFLLSPENVQIKYFDSSLIESGYITSQTNSTTPMNETEDSVLGQFTAREVGNTKALGIFVILASTTLLGLVLLATKSKMLPYSRLVRN